MNTTENNKLIAEFMGKELKVPIKGFGIPTINTLKYHSSWDWLIPVVEKIESLDRLAGIVTINQNCCNIKSNMLGDKTVMSNQGGSNYMEENTKLSNTYKAVVEFIKWYNENK